MHARLIPHPRFQALLDTSGLITRWCEGVGPSKAMLKKTGDSKTLDLSQHISQPFHGLSLDRKEGHTTWLKSLLLPHTLTGRKPRFFDETTGLGLHVFKDSSAFLTHQHPHNPHNTSPGSNTTVSVCSPPLAVNGDVFRSLTAETLFPILSKLQKRFQDTDLHLCAGLGSTTLDNNPNLHAILDLMATTLAKLIPEHSPFATTVTLPIWDRGHVDGLMVAEQGFDRNAVWGQPLVGRQNIAFLWDLFLTLLTRGLGPHNGAAFLWGNTHIVLNDADHIAETHHNPTWRFPQTGKPIGGRPDIVFPQHHEDRACAINTLKSDRHRPFEIRFSFPVRQHRTPPSQHDLFRQKRHHRQALDWLDEDQQATVLRLWGP